jgi:2-phospho-L-lactate guanylyltransferase (CobY/MobA/RfbA family)
VPAIVVPYRGDAKRRLPQDVRAAAALAMLGDVVEACVEVGRTLVVTDDGSVVPREAEAVADPGDGQGAAVLAGLARVDGPALVVNADLPRVTPAVLRLLGGAGLALVAGRDGTTNALSLPEPALFAPLYGAGSAARFLAHAPFAVLDVPELADDVDTPEDLERVAPLGGRRTRALLALR